MLPDSPLLGIDFGTSNTAAAVRCADGEVRAVLFDGMPQLPSAVALDDSAGLLVGRDALYAVRTSPGRVELYPKQRIDEDVLLLGAAEVPVVDAIRAVLRRVDAEAARVSGAPVRRAVLTVPAGWGAVRRRVLRAAAGGVFAHVRLVPEPVAAASYFAATGRARPGPVVVYDLGAGTFDVAVVERSGDGFAVRAAGGLPDAGGLDIDATIVGHLGATLGPRDPDRWRRLGQPDSDVDRRLSRQLWDDVRGAKEVLSRATAARIPVPLFDDDVPLGREQFDALARPVLERTAAATRGVLRAAGVGPADLAGIELVGGSSRIPLVATLLHQAFGIAPSVVEQPELAVAQGAVRVAADPPRTSSPPVPASAPDDGRPDDGWPDNGSPGDVASAAARTPGPAAGPGAQGGARRGGRARVGLAAAALLGATLLLVAAAAWAGRNGGGDDPPGDQAAGGPTSIAAATSAATPTPSPAPLTGAACVVGTWRATRIQYAPANYYGTMVSVRGAGTIYIYRPDGTGLTVVDNVSYTGRKGGRTYRETHDGRLVWEYQASEQKIIYTASAARGTAVIRVNGVVRERRKMTVAEGESDVDFICRGDGMVISADSYTLRLVRERR